MPVHASENLGIVTLSIIVAIFASFTSLNLAGRLRAGEGRARLWWLIAAACALGGGIWSMHFIGMEGLVMPMPAAYDAWLTALSLLAAVLATGAGLGLLTVFRDGWRPTLAAGFLVAAGIVTMHYVGMAGMEMPGLRMTYDPPLVVASLAIAFAAATAALWLAFHTTRFRERALAACAMGVAIAGMHYTAIAAASFSLDSHFDRMRQGGAAIPESGLAFIVAAATLALLMLALLAAYFDRRIAALTAHEAAALRHAAAVLSERNSRFEWAINNMAQGLCMFDKDKRLVVCNRQYAELYNLRPEDVRVGESLDNILEQRLASGNIPLQGLDAFRESRTSVADSGKPRSDLFEMQDGRFIQIIHRGLPDGGWVATHQDVTEQRRMEGQIRFLAQHDPLTGLANRTYFREHMAEVEPRIGAGELYAVIFMDLDRFKPVNDTHGHMVGDSVLATVGRRIVDCAGAKAFVARLGGDEFAVTLGPINQPEEAAELARNLVKSVSEPMEIGGHTIQIGTSIGIAIGPTDGADGPRLMKNADLALYRSKADARGSYHFFQPALDAALQSRKRCEKDLGEALAAGQLSLAYQPLINLKQARISGFEALLRWNHPERGSVPPSEFIPVAEETGLIASIGEWVLRQACLQAAQWPDDIFVAINLSAVQFKEGSVVDVVIDALAASGVVAARIELEITETVLLTNTDAVLRALNRLRELGIRIALDDFGTGFSSLGYLQTFPFDKLKIDRSFLKSLTSRPESKAIVKAAAALGASLGMITTAEGIETADQLVIVREQGYTEVQGYLFSLPLPASEATRLLANPDGLRWLNSKPERQAIRA